MLDWLNGPNVAVVLFFILALSLLDLFDGASAASILVREGDQLGR